jgi:hypothetical protein
MQPNSQPSCTHPPKQQPIHQTGQPELAQKLSSKLQVLENQQDNVLLASQQNNKVYLDDSSEIHLVHQVPRSMESASSVQPLAGSMESESSVQPLLAPAPAGADEGGELRLCLEPVTASEPVTLYPDTASREPGDGYPLADAIIDVDQMEGAGQGDKSASGGFAITYYKHSDQICHFKHSGSDLEETHTFAMLSGSPSSSQADHHLSQQGRGAAEIDCDQEPGAMICP